jgi:hypothetical protein
MICCLCKQAITASQEIEHHHPIYKSRGGTETAPAHKACHRQRHSEEGDFAAWGRIGGKLSSITRVLVNQSQKRQHASRIRYG